MLRNCIKLGRFFRLWFRFPERSYFVNIYNVQLYRISIYVQTEQKQCVEIFPQILTLFGMI